MQRPPDPAEVGSLRRRRSRASAEEGPVGYPATSVRGASRDESLGSADEAESESRANAAGDRWQCLSHRWPPPMPRVELALCAFVWLAHAAFACYAAWRASDVFADRAW